MLMKLRLKMKKRSQRYDINRPRPRHVHKYTKHKMYLIKMMVICIKKHLSNIYSSIHEKRKQHRGSIEKSFAYKKLVVRSLRGRSEIGG